MHRRPARGFTYLGMIILLAILGLVGAAGLKMGTLLQRAAAEEELLEIGAQFSEALRSYAAATPQGQPQQPPNLQALLKDPRFPNPRRHLRKIFVDPVTGKAEWGVIYLGDKVGVLGVYSLSNARPLKIANFDIRFQNMDNRERISDWKFLMAGGDGVAPSVLTPPNSMTGAPSLFGPGTPAAAGEPKPVVGAGPVPPELRQPNEPVDPAPPEEGGQEQGKPEQREPPQPTQPPADEEKEPEPAEPVPEPDDDDTAKPAEPSPIVTPLPPLPPPVSGRRRGT